MARKDVWDVGSILGNTVIITAAEMPPTAGVIVEQDSDTITLRTQKGRVVVVLKETITSLTQAALGEV